MPKIVDHDQQRSELSATVARVVAGSGLENTTLRTVAAHHGCTKGMVQHYFADKEELLLAALNYVEDRCEARMPGAGDDLLGLDLVQARLHAQLPVKPEILGEWQVRLAFHNRAALSSEMRRVLSQRYSEQQRVGVNSLRQARKSRQLRDGLQLPNTWRSLVALVSGIGVGAVMNPAQLPPVAQRQMLKTAIDDLRT